MNLFSRKIFSGVSPTDKDWENHLAQAHGKTPGMTEKCFAGFPTDLGPNTYEVMASALDEFQGKPIEVLDLACGDGYITPLCLSRMQEGGRFVGVDMVASEVGSANERFRRENVEFLQARAQELPFPSGSFDVVICHLALMLMVPIEPVVAEVRRVLRPGGTFAAVVGRNASSGGLYGLMGSEISQFIKTELSKGAAFRTGDSRLESREGIQELFDPRYFLPNINFQDFTLKISGAPGTLMGILEHFYILNILGEAAKKKVRADLLRHLEGKAKQQGEVLLGLPLLKFKVKTR
ncbi:MAG: class I SAM-dependent methyltransferase [Elusimicrobia bacterium]|nr:class I SAM-dependent methyltransferase [Elusimicrobiota bacterium]